MGGIFGSKREYYWDSSSTPLLINSDLYSEFDSGNSTGIQRPWPSLLRQTIASSIVGNRNIGSDLQSNLINGVYTKATAMYNYGKQGETGNGGFLRGLPSGKTIFIPAGSPDQVKSVIMAEIGQQIIVSYCLIDEEADGNLWYDVEYYLLNANSVATGLPISWRYMVSTGTHPSLEPKVRQQDAISPYYPIVPIREKGQSIKETDVDLYKSGRQALRFIGLTYDKLDDAIHDDSNIDLDDLDHAYVIIAVDIATKVPNSNLYLYTHLDKLYHESGVKEEDHAYWEANTRHAYDGESNILPPPPPMNRLEVSDGRYKMVLGWKYINKELKTGNIGKIDFITKVPTILPETEIKKEGDFFPAYVVDNSILTLRKQVTATQYEEMTIYGMVHTNYIGSQGTTIHTSLEQAFTTDTDDDKNNFIIPLRQDVVKFMGVIAGHDLMYDSIRLVMNSHGYQKLKWYQTGIFKVAVVITAVVISIWNAPAGTALLSAAMAGIVLTAVVTTLLTMQVLAVGLQMVEDLAGPELALAAAIAYSIYTGDFEKASAYIDTGAIIVGGVKSLYDHDALAKIEEEMEFLDDELAKFEAEEAIRAEDLLWTSNVLDDTSYLLTQPSNFLRKTKLEMKAEIDLVSKTHLFVESLQFTDRPYSYIKLGLKPTQA